MTTRFPSSGIHIPNRHGLTEEVAYLLAMEFGYFDGSRELAERLVSDYAKDAQEGE